MEATSDGIREKGPIAVSGGHQEEVLSPSLKYNVRISDFKTCVTCVACFTSFENIYREWSWHFWMFILRFPFRRKVDLTVCVHIWGTCNGYMLQLTLFASSMT